MKAIWLDFINSDWQDHRTGRHEDRLLQPAWIEQFLADWELQPAQLLDIPTQQELIGLRTLLQHIIHDYRQGMQPSDEHILALNSYLEQSLLKRQLIATGKHYQLTEAPEQRNWRWVEAEIAASFANALLHADFARVKTCENVNCNWVYYDESRNQSRRWCDEECGNIIKVRRFRARQREHTRR